MSAAAGVLVGTAGGAYAYSGSFQHTAGLWNHGIDGHHYYMTRTDGGSSTGILAEIDALCGGGTAHSPETSYAANHVHNDGGGSLCTHIIAAHFSSPGPYLGHHEHS